MDAFIIPFGLFFYLILFVVWCFFCLSYYNAMKRIPETYQGLPDWLIWFMLIPFIGFIIAWIMLPFGLPRALMRYSAFEPTLAPLARKLFQQGLTTQILVTLSLLFSWLPFIGTLLSIAALVFFVLYWMGCAEAKRMIRVTGSAGDYAIHNV
jgi:hypothetical protein